MSKNTDHTEFHFTISHLIRLGLFLALVAIFINYLSFSTSSYSSSDPTILGSEDTSSPPKLTLKDLSGRALAALPPHSREILTNLDRQPVIINGRNSLTSLQKVLDGFPQKQIKQLQKEIIDRLYQTALESLNK